MKLPIKLKNNELHDLILLLESVLNGHVCESRTEAIVTNLVLKFYQKLKQKSILFEKSTLTIQVETETAMAFVEFFETKLFNNYSLGGNIVNKMIAIYDTKTAHFF